MKLYLSGLENAIDIQRGTSATLEIHNRILFERVCRSLMLNDGDNDVEPFVFSNAEGKIESSKNRLLVVPSPLSLPWNSAELGGALYRRMEELLEEDMVIASSVESLSKELFSQFLTLALRLQSDYRFGYDWDVSRYVKAFRFDIEHDATDSTFEKCIKFFSLVHDVSLEKVLVVFSLKQFLSCEELKQVFEHIFLLSLRVLLVEGQEDATRYPHERKYVIDQHFLEF